MVKKAKDQEKKGFNILEHNLVPKHRILTDKEREELLTGLNISEIQLPSMSVKDAINKTLVAKPGQIVEIIRNTRTGKSAYYRRIV